MNYGQGQAIKVLAAERIGFSMAYAAMAKMVLEGRHLHVMHTAAISSEAVDFHNQICNSPEMVALANAHVLDLIAEYNLI